MKAGLKDVIKRRREELGLSQPQLAKRASVAQGTIGNIESGLRTNPNSLPREPLRTIGLQCPAGCPKLVFTHYLDTV